jgi:hypothetical protein
MEDRSWRWVFRAAVFFICAGFFMSALLPSGIIAQEDAALESAWRDVLEIGGAQVPAGAGLGGIVGPLPSDDELLRRGGLTTADFLSAFRSSDKETQQAMGRFVRARLRELARRGVLDGNRVDALLGPEPAGVRGSSFFGIPPIPGDSYQAMMDYILVAAAMIPGSSYEPSLEDREKLDRSLQASFAISSPRVRRQYMDFDVVWTTARMELMCASDRERDSLAPDLLWLYVEIIGSAGLDWLPAPPADLREKILLQGSGLFARAREESRSMPDSLAAVTAYRCEER